MNKKSGRSTTSKCTINEDITINKTKIIQSLDKTKDNDSANHTVIGMSKIENWRYGCRNIANL